MISRSEYFWFEIEQTRSREACDARWSESLNDYDRN